jgi:uncharacterized damage-inducible protein DinB
VKEAARIADQLKRSFDGDAWHGPAVKQLLEGVSANDALARPIPGAHNIWELTVHIGAWENAGLRRLNGDRAELTDEEDWAAVNEKSEEAWNQIKSKLETEHTKLVQAIEGLDESRLDEPILEGMRSVYITLHGVIQHNLYHAGQIAILKKALAGRTS